MVDFIASKNNNNSYDDAIADKALRSSTIDNCVIVALFSNGVNDSVNNVLYQLRFKTIFLVFPWQNAFSRFLVCKQSSFHINTGIKPSIAEIAIPVSYITLRRYF